MKLGRYFKQLGLLCGASLLVACGGSSGSSSSNKAPVITSAATFSVAENQLSAFTITATDEDNDTIVYSLEGGADVGMFNIGSSTGVVTFKVAPDYETKSSYSIVVGADDGSDKTTKSITVSITDVFEPALTSMPVITSLATATVPENQFSAITIVASDFSNSTMIYSIEPGADASSFDINSSTGVVTFKVAPDYETKSSYTFVAAAYNGSLKGTKSITITVSDIAENSEAVITSASAVSVAENQTSILRVTATDADGDTLSYLISGGVDATSVAINSSTGVLVFTVAPDYETKSSYSLIVGVSDGSSITTQELNITITDVAEGSAPIIATTSTQNANENQSRAFVVVATDIDADVITYTIEGGADANKFDINASSGVVTFKVAPDYETKSSYVVMVGAKDATHTTTKEITVSINNLDGASLVPQTAQTTSYVADDDGDYESGVTREFKDKSISLLGASFGHTLIDKATSLEWFNESVSDANHSGAQSFCENSVFALKSDWRLPTIDELNTLANRSKSNPVSFSELDGMKSSGFYWSLTAYKRGASSNMHYIYAMNGGLSLAWGDTLNGHVRCVRDTKEPRYEPLNRSNSVVYDAVHGLEWSDYSGLIFVNGGVRPNSIKEGTFAEAIAGCESLYSANKRDWRLPNINELATVVDFDKSSGSIFDNAFSLHSSGDYISSTTYEQSNSSALYINSKGFILAGSKSRTYKYRCVRTTGD